MDTTIIVDRIFFTLKIQLFFERIFLASKTVRIGNDLKSSWMLSGYAMVVLLLYGICAVNDSNEINEYSWAKGYLWYSVATFKKISSKISYVGIVLMMQMQASKQIQVFKKIIHIDSILWTKYKESVNHSSLRRIIIIRTSTSFLILLFNTIGRFMSTIDLNKIGIYQGIFSMLPFYLENITHLWIMFGYVTYLELIRTRFKLLAHMLTTFKLTSSGSVIREDLRILTLLNSELLSIITVVSSIYGTILIIRLGYDFVELLVTSYIMLILIVDPTTMPSYFLYLCILWIVLISIRYIQTFVYVDSVVEQVIVFVIPLFLCAILKILFIFFKGNLLY